MADTHQQSACHLPPLRGVAVAAGAGETTAPPAVAVPGSAVAERQDETGGWRERLNDFLTRRQRVAQDRAAMTRARGNGLARRHAQRLRRVRDAATPTTDATTPTAPREAVHAQDAHHHADQPADADNQACQQRTGAPSTLVDEAQLDFNLGGITHG